MVIHFSPLYLHSSPFLPFKLTNVDCIYRLDFLKNNISKSDYKYYLCLMSVIHCLSLPMHTSPKSLHWHSGPKYKTSTITFQKITNLFMSELSKEALGTASIERDTVTTHTHNISMIKYLLAARADNSGRGASPFCAAPMQQHGLITFPFLFLICPCQGIWCIPQSRAWEEWCLGCSCRSTGGMLRVSARVALHIWG